MITIPLTDKWRVQSDTYSWALAKAVKCKPSEKRPDGIDWQMQTWHRTLDSAIRYFFDQQLRDKAAVGFREALAEAEKIKEVVDSALVGWDALRYADASKQEHLE